MSKAKNDNNGKWTALCRRQAKQASKSDVVINVDASPIVTKRKAMMMDMYGSPSTTSKQKQDWEEYSLLSFSLFFSLITVHLDIRTSKSHRYYIKVIRLSLSHTLSSRSSFTLTSKQMRYPVVIETYAFLSFSLLSLILYSHSCSLFFPRPHQKKKKNSQSFRSKGERKRDGPFFFPRRRTFLTFHFFALKEEKKNLFFCLARASTGGISFLSPFPNPHCATIPWYFLWGGEGKENL